MTIPKIVTFHEEVRAHNGKDRAQPLRRAVLGAVLANPRGGQPLGTSLEPLIELSVESADAPRPDELVLLVAQATGPRPHARSNGPDQAEVDALMATFET